MTRIELELKAEKYKKGLIGLGAFMSAVDAYSSASNNGNAIVSGSLLKDWQMWEDCILSFLKTYPKVREDFNKHVDEWNTHTKLPPSAYERGEQ